MSTKRVLLASPLEKWNSQLPGDLLAVRIKAFAFVETFHSSINIFGPESSEDIHAELNIWKPVIFRLVWSQTLHTRWVEGPIRRAVRKLKALVGL
jgi:hypothetical protein